MILDIDNCGGIRLVPYGETQPTTYWWGDWSENFACGNYLSYACIRQGSLTPWYQGYSSRVMMPGLRDNTKPILDFSGRVFLDGLNVLDDSPNSTGQMIGGGGYLGTKTIHIEFDKGGYSGGTYPDHDDIYVSVLGIYPSTFNGGLRISGLNSPPNQLSTVPDPIPPNGIQPVESAYFSGQYGRSYSTIARINGRRCYCLNERAVLHTGGNWLNNGRWNPDQPSSGIPYCYVTCNMGGVIGNGVFVSPNYMWPIYDED